MLLKIWQHLDEINWGSSKAWIMTTTRHLCIDFVRRRKRLGRLNSFANKEDLDEKQTNLVESNPFEMAQASTLKVHISGAQQQLPEIQRSAIIMREIQDMSYHEISKALVIPLNSTKVYIMRGRQALRSILTKSLKGELKDV